MVDARYGTDMILIQAKSLTNMCSFEQLGQHSVVIVVGKAKELYSVHIDLLCEHSPHFHAALKTKVEGIVPSKLTLPNVRSTTFARFLGWLYFRTGIYKEAH